jgi:hypothetical protein
MLQINALKMYIHNLYVFFVRFSKAGSFNLVSVRTIHNLTLKYFCSETHNDKNVLLA